MEQIMRKFTAVSREVEAKFHLTQKEVVGLVELKTSIRDAIVEVCPYWWTLRLLTYRFTDRDRISQNAIAAT